MDWGMIEKKRTWTDQITGSKLRTPHRYLVRGLQRPRPRPEPTGQEIKPSAHYSPFSVWNIKRPCFRLLVADVVKGAHVCMLHVAYK
jgi:hypothetical protein